eukprot:GHVU01078881.1.p1 GENE.GHVU01078881.1~~GHVU01078881.1.p1  ORF type:complete len:213 (+),score=12.60 GHVU01078881.1:424-1062(+)
MGNALDTAMRIYSLLEPLGNFIAPSEYGLKRDQKVEIGVKTVRTLIKKVLSDITYPRSVCEDEAATVSVALPRRKLSLEKIAVRHHRHYHPHHHRPHHHRPSGITASQAPSQTPSCQREESFASSCSASPQAATPAATSERQRPGSGRLCIQSLRSDPIGPSSTERGLGNVVPPIDLVRYGDSLPPTLNTSSSSAGPSGPSLLSLHKAEVGR